MINMSGIQYDDYGNTKTIPCSNSVKFDTKPFNKSSQETNEEFVARWEAKCEEITRKNRQKFDYKCWTHSNKILKFERMDGMVHCFEGWSFDQESSTWIFGTENEGAGVFFKDGKWYWIVIQYDDEYTSPEGYDSFYEAMETVRVKLRELYVFTQNYYMSKASEQAMTV